MRAVIQRVNSAQVSVAGEVCGQIDSGLLVFLGVGKSDDPAAAELCAEKLLNLRVFEDEAGKMNRSVLETGQDILLVSQFTLWGDVRRGRRPGFELAARPETAKSLYEDVVKVLKNSPLKVQTGIFQAEMTITAVHDGPVTILLDTDKVF